MLQTNLVVWRPYSGSAAVELSILLLILGAALILLGRRMTKDVKLPRMGIVLGVVVVAIWAFSILTFLKINRELARYTGSAGNLGPIFPITITSAVCTFVLVAYVSRQGGILAALGNGFLGFIAGPMVFELPFVLIVTPQVSAPLKPGVILFFISLLAIVITSLVMLLFSRRIAVTKFSMYFLGAMVLVFGVWALEGYSYPSDPTAFTLNAISKVLAFASVASLFVTENKPNTNKVV